MSIRAGSRRIIREPAVDRIAAPLHPVSRQELGPPAQSLTSEPPRDGELGPAGCYVRSPKMTVVMIRPVAITRGTPQSVLKPNA